MTQETESVCLGRLKRAVIHYMIKRSVEVEPPVVEGTPALLGY